MFRGNRAVCDLHAGTHDAGGYTNTDRDEHGIAHGHEYAGTLANSGELPDTQAMARVTSAATADEGHAT